jgi:carbon-monoxide dehydrogenase medium subunit
VTFDYHAARSLPEALDLLARHGEDAHLVAGGTAFVLLWRQGLLRPAHVVGLRDVKELRGITRTDDGGLVIGATVTHREAERSPAVAAFCPALAATFASVATIRVRNQATVGGNLAHADPAQDPPAMLLALDAEAVIASPSGERRIPLRELFVDYLQSSLALGEILRAVRIPPLPKGTRASYTKFLPKTHDDYATVSVAAVLRRDADGRVADARIALGAAGPTPVRATRVEQALVGTKPDAKGVADAAALVQDAIDPLDDVRGSAAYKREMARVWTQRALVGLLA